MSTPEELSVTSLPLTTALSSSVGASLPNPQVVCMDTWLHKNTML
jgi:hypothetical protein